jgi:hypothetical protein
MKASWAPRMPRMVYQMTQYDIPEVSNFQILRNFSIALDHILRHI